MEDLALKRSNDLENINPVVGVRHTEQGNKFGLIGMDHFALPTHNMKLMERFVRDVLGGVPYYYAGFDQKDKELGRKPHIFIRVGKVLFQCTEENAAMFPDKSNNDISPHWAFDMSPADLDANAARIRRLGIPVQGPVQHRGVDLTSIYFLSPEGHKIEFCTWDFYPPEKATMGPIRWSELAHDWPNVS